MSKRICSLFSKEQQEQFENELRDVVKRHIKSLGGYEEDHDVVMNFLVSGDYKLIKSIFKKVAEDTIERFKSTGKTRTTWPFNDKTLKINTTFVDIYRSLGKHSLSREGRSDVERIIAAGGKPCFNNASDDRKYGGGRYGDVVVELDADVIKEEVGCSVSTVYDYVNRMCDAKVIVKLKTARNEPGLYVIGRWQPYPSGFSVHRYLNDKSMRNEIREGLVRCGLAKEVTPRVKRQSRRS